MKMKTMNKITQEQAERLLDLVKDVWIFGDTTMGCVGLCWAEERNRLISEIEGEMYAHSVDVLGALVEIEKAERIREMYEGEMCDE